MSQVTSLYQAVKRGDLECVRRLVVDEGMDVNIKFKDRNNYFFKEERPLHVAVKHHHIEIVKFLLNNGADIDTSDRFGSILLHWGFYGDIGRVSDDMQPTMLEILLKHGADVNHKMDFGFTPLSFACLFGTANKVALLVAHDADVNSCSIHGINNINMAARNKESGAEIMKLLINHGVAVTSSDCKGATPLHAAVKCDNIEAITLLLANHADVNARDCKGKTPLYVVQVVKPSKLLQVLIDNNADLDVTDNGGDTPLHQFLTNVHLEIDVDTDDLPLIRTVSDGIKALLGAGARLDIQNDNGETPLSLAFKRKLHPEHIQAILLHCRSAPHAYNLHSLMMMTNKKGYNVYKYVSRIEDAQLLAEMLTNDGKDILPGCHDIFTQLLFTRQDNDAIKNVDSEDAEHPYTWSFRDFDEEDEESDSNDDEESDSNDDEESDSNDDEESDSNDDEESDSNDDEESDFEFDGDFNLNNDEESNFNDDMPKFAEYLRLFIMEELATPDPTLDDAEATTSIAVNFNPRQNNFQRVLALQCLSNLCGSWRKSLSANKTEVSNIRERNTMDLPESVCFIVMGYLSPLDVMRRD